MSILDTRRIAAITFAVISLLTLSVAHADRNQRDGGIAHAASQETQRSARAANTWVQTKYFWLQHTTACEAAPPTVNDPAREAGSISSWKAARYPALQVTDQVASPPLSVASGPGADSQKAWLRSKYSHLNATAPAQQAIELVCTQ